MATTLEQAAALSKWKKSERKIEEELLAQELGYDEYFPEWGRPHLGSDPDRSFFFSDLDHRLWMKLVDARMKLRKCK